MKKVFISILLILAALTVSKNAISLTSEKVYYNTTTSLYLRTGAGSQYPIVCTLKKGVEVELISKNGDWYQIKYLEKIGFAFSKYLKYNRTLSNSNLQSSSQEQPFIGIIIIVVIILIIGFIVYKKIQDKELLETVTKTYRGTWSERDLVLALLKYGIPAQNIFHDLYLRKNNDDFSQIDLVVITEVGIIVIEVKDYSGWIFGSGNQNQWTQVLAYGKQKYRLYNPIMQNSKHIVELRKQLNHFGNIPFYSLIVFYGDCVLKEINFVPNGTFIVKQRRVFDVMKVIMKNNKPANYTNINDVFRILKEAVKNGENREIQRRHKENIKDMLGKHRIYE